MMEENKYKKWNVQRKKSEWDVRASEWDKDRMSVRKREKENRLENNVR